MEKRARILGIILIILIIAFVVTIIMLNKKDPEVEQKIEVNKELSTDDAIMLLKKAVPELTSSDNIETSAITDEDIIRFSINYLQIVDRYSVNTSEGGMEASSSIADVDEVAQTVFNRNINWDSVSYVVKDNKVTIPVFMGSTDVQIFKLRQKEYDEINGYYTVYIDSLEPTSGTEMSELKEVTTTSYSKDNIIYTLIFRYKEVNGTKVLLSYKRINNI